MAGVRMVHHIQLWPEAVLARSINRASSPMMLRWNATAASPQSPPATIVTASRRCRSLGMRRNNQA